MEWLLETRRFPYLSLPQLLHDEVLAGRPSLVVAGTHGKTTTSALAAFLLRENNAAPGWLIGGVPRDLDCGSHLGDPAAPFVIEGDEYDSAFFDKRSKFIHYAPRVLALGNIEFDHADIFFDLRDVLRSFRHVTRIVPRNGFILANGDDENVAGLVRSIDWCPVVTVGTGEGTDLRITDYAEDAASSVFTLHWRGREWAQVRWKLTGFYNVRNAAMAALAAGLARDPGDPTTLDLAPLSRFQGVRRRQEVLYESEKLVVIEDFGHHPTALRHALEGIERRYPGTYISACFEPRSNTARTSVFQQELPQALLAADQILLGPVHRGSHLNPSDRLDTEAVAAALRLGMPRREAIAFDSHEALLDAAIHAYRRRMTLEKQVFVFFTNGAFGGIMPKFVQQASQAEPA